MKLIRLSVLFSALAITSNVHADIYKRVDADGHVTYSSKPIKGAKKLQLEPLPTMLSPKAGGSTSEFRVDGKTQNRRDDTRRKILEDELATEEKGLDEARAKLKEAEDNPEVYKSANGQTFRNVAKFEEKVNAAQDEMKIHEANVEALKTELSNLK
jgi:hypothetical protein